MLIDSLSWPPSECKIERVAGGLLKSCATTFLCGLLTSAQGQCFKYMLLTGSVETRNLSGEPGILTTTFSARRVHWLALKTAKDGHNSEFDFSQPNGRKPPERRELVPPEFGGRELSYSPQSGVGLLYTRAA